MIIGISPLKDHTNINFFKYFLKYFNGYDKIILPFFLDSPKIGIAKQTLLELNEIKDNRNIIEPQILASLSDIMIKQAKVLKKYGWNNININVGCPYEKIIKKRKGSFFLQNPVELLDNIETITKMNINLSIKMRLGYSKLSEGINLLKTFKNIPVSSYIVHARYSIDKYFGEIKLNDFKKIMNNSQTDIYFNGDIKQYSDILKIKKEIPNLKGIFIGRGFLENPAMFESISEKDKYDKLYAFYLDLFEVNSHKNNFINFMKGYWIYFRKWFDLSDLDYLEINKENNPDKHLLKINCLFKNKIETLNQDK